MPSNRVRRVLAATVSVEARSRVQGALIPCATAAPAGCHPTAVLLLLWLLLLLPGFPFFLAVANLHLPLDAAMTDGTGLVEAQHRTAAQSAGV